MSTVEDRVISLLCMYFHYF